MINSLRRTGLVGLTFLKSVRYVSFLRPESIFNRRDKRNEVSSQRALSVNSSSESASASNPEYVYDIVISGGGMVGAAMACSLGHEELLQGKKVLLLESAARKDFRELPEKFHNRVCALSKSTVNLLSSFGAWEQIEKMRCQPVKRMQIWDSCSDSVITLNNDDLADDLAYIVENDVILEGITRQLDRAAAGRVQVLYETKAAAYEMPENRQTLGNPLVKVHLESGETLLTKLLIGADGFASLVRKTAGFHTIGWDYKQAAVVAILKIAQHDNTVAWQRFLPTGPIALLPLPNDLISLVWTTTHDNAKNLLKLSPESFVDAINDAYWHDRHKNPIAQTVEQAFDGLLSTVLPGPKSGRQLPPTVIDVQEGSQAMFPLTLVHASQYVKPRVAVIGDAAHRIHPLAGQGVNLGFGDVTCLTRLIVEAVRNGADIGSLTSLLPYETERQRRNLPVMFAMDALKRLYSTDFTPVVLLRSLGLQATNSLKCVKDRIIAQAAA